MSQDQERPQPVNVELKPDRGPVLVGLQHCQHVLGMFDGVA
jgi:hypothetical protein